MALRYILSQRNREGLAARLTATGTSGALGTIGVTALNVAVSLTITVLLARLLGPNQFGEYSFIYVLVLVFSVPLTYGLRTLLVREVAVLSDREDWPALGGLLRGSVYVWLGYCLTLLLMLALARHALRSDWFGIAPDLFVLAFVLLPSVAAIAALSAVVTGLHRVFLGQAANLLFRPILLIVGIVAVWMADPPRLSAYDAIWLNVLAALFAAALALALALRLLPKAAVSSRPEYDFAAWSRSIVPLTINAAVGLVYSYIDIIILGTIGTKEGVGQYRVATQGALFVLLVMQALNAFVSPKIATQFSRRELASLHSLLIRYALVAFVPAGVVVVIYLGAGKSLLSLVFGNAYIAAWGPLVILSLGQLGNVATGFVGPVLNMTGHERETVVGTTLSALLNLVLNMLLIPPLGTIGAAIATGISIVFWNIYLSWRAFRVTGLTTSPLWRAATRSWRKG